MSERRVLLLGGSGLLGRALLRHVPPGVTVSAPSRVELPLEDADGIEARLRGADITHVVLAAAWTRVDDCESDPERAFRTNGLLPGRIARRAARAGLPLTLLGTDYVFSGAEATPRSESDPVAPLGVYGRSKWCGECEVRAASPDHRIVRTSGLYGQGGPDFVAAVAPRLLQGEVRVVADQVLAPTWVDALAPAVWRVALESEPGTFHLTCGGEVSWYGFARAVAEGIGVDLERVVATTTAELGRPAPRPAYSVLSNQRARELLGLTLPSWDDALRRYLAQAEFRS